MSMISIELLVKLFLFLFLFFFGPSRPLNRDSF